MPAAANLTLETTKRHFHSLCPIPDTCQSPQVRGGQDTSCVHQDLATCSAQTLQDLLSPICEEEAKKKHLQQLDVFFLYIQ